MDNQPNLWEREPAVIVGSVMAVIGALVTFGILEWSTEEIAAVEVALVACVPLVAGLVAPFISRRYTTPIKNPHTEAGEPAALVPLRAVEEPNGG